MMEIAPRLERARLRLHFAGELMRLRAAPAPAHSRAADRAATLERLDAYARGGRFPLHGGRGKPRPVFVDHRGTHCAVGHLLAGAGHAGLVSEIHHTRNHAFIAELADVGGLPAALAGLGITREEAARIQPSYSGGVSPMEPAQLDNPIPFLIFLLVSVLLAFGSLALTAAILLSRRVKATIWDARPRLQPWICAVMICGYTVLGLYVIFIVV
jgi:hypothetical protein